MAEIPQLDKIITVATMKEVLIPLGEKARDVLYKRIKDGYGISPGLKRVRLKPLSQSYKEWRQGRAVYFQKGGKLLRVSKQKWKDISAPELGDFGKPTKSNLTLTGQLLNSISSRINESGKVEVFIPDNVRSGIRLKNGKVLPNRSRLTNAKLATYVQEQGRPFFEFTDGELRILTDAYQDLINEALTRFTI